MSSFFKPFFRSAVLAAAFLCSTQPGALAQGKGPAGTNPNEFKITKLSNLKNECRQKPTSIKGNSAKSKEWGVFDVSFATAPEWIDGLFATFTVVLADPKNTVKAGNTSIPQLTLFETTIEYPNVEKGNEHTVGVVLPPAALLRYGVPVGFAVRFSVAGQEIASQGVAEGTIKNLLKIVGESWWASPKLLDAPFLQKLDGYLVDRMKSPFLLVNIDSYEVSR